MLISSFFVWASEHYFLAFCLMYAALTTLGRVICRTYRMVTTRGWPTTPLMDADGDIVHPNKEDDA